VQIGYNWLAAPRWVVGLEADLQASGIRGSAYQVTTPPFADQTGTGVSKSIGWFGTVRGRVGFLIDPQWLLYATGGLAYG
ncbi:outer membrane protein, partial [Klebsiella oxytoca]|uniref:outer membrane protein n=1 Tax=Klebsiella oxytoca TaxID=571 RepID=UPI001953BC43